jgi:crossover junction endodeoxyribonuclease RusA
MTGKQMQNTVELPYPPPELDPDKKCCWRVKSKVSMTYRKKVYSLCKEANLISDITGKVHLSIDIYPPNADTLDQTNCIVMIKYALKTIAEYLHVNDRNFIYHWVYHCYQDEYKGEIHIEIIPDTNMENVVKIREHVDKSREKAKNE